MNGPNEPAATTKPDQDHYLRLETWSLNDAICLYAEKEPTRDRRTFNRIASIDKPLMKDLFACLFARMNLPSSERTTLEFIVPPHAEEELEDAKNVMERVKPLAESIVLSGSTVRLQAAMEERLAFRVGSLVSVRPRNLVPWAIERRLPLPEPWKEWWAMQQADKAPEPETHENQPVLLDKPRPATPKWLSQQPKKWADVMILKHEHEDKVRVRICGGKSRVATANDLKMIDGRTKSANGEFRFLLELLTLQSHAIDPEVFRTTPAGLRQKVWRLNKAMRIAFNLSTNAVDNYQTLARRWREQHPNEPTPQDIRSGQYCIVFRRESDMAAPAKWKHGVRSADDADDE